MQLLRMQIHFFVKTQEQLLFEESACLINEQGRDLSPFLSSFHTNKGNRTAKA